MIIQQVLYTNYFTAIAKDLSLGLPLDVELENYLPNQVAKLKMRKKYPWDVKSDSAISVNLQDLAETVDFDAINCPGYHVDLHRIGYYLFLTPTNDSGGDESDIEFINIKIKSRIKYHFTVETGIMKPGQNRQSFSTGEYNVPPRQVSGDALTFTREPGNQNTRNSINLYQFVYTPSASFSLNSEESLILHLPVELESIPGLTELGTVQGLEDFQNGDESIIIQLTLESEGIRAKGYSTFGAVDGSFTISTYLQNKLPSNNILTKLYFYNTQDNETAVILQSLRDSITWLY